uniref:RING-type domain-containing protein n=1 Tax=Anopheles atroparvus TaxID=41427 RepID=A0AAG5CVP6_ANOAO
MSYVQLAVYGMTIVVAVGVAVYQLYTERQSNSATGFRSSSSVRDICVFCITGIPEGRSRSLSCGHTCHEKCFAAFKGKCTDCH